MKRIYRILLLLCISLFFLGCKDESHDRAFIQKTLEQGLLPVFSIKGQPIPRMTLEDRMRQHHVPGVSLAVINKNALEWAAGYGVIETGSSGKITTKTLFQATSLSKVVTAMAVLSFVEQGKLRLDDDVNTWLQSWKVPKNEFTTQQSVTLRQLLSHSAGVTVGEFFGYPPHSQIPTLQQILNGQPPANSQPIQVVETPGKTWRYSGGGYIVVQQLLEDLTEQPFGELMKQNIFKKLNMQNSAFQQPLPQKLTASAATGHNATGQPIPGKWFTYPEMAAAGLWSTPSDMARLMLESLQAKQGDSTQLFSKTLAETAFRPQIGNSAFAGAMKGEGEDVWLSSGGSTMGFRSFMVLFPARGQGAIVMTNADTGHQLAMEIMRGIAEVYDWPDFRIQEKPLVNIKPERTAQYAGVYEFMNTPQKLTIQIIPQENGLEARLPGETFTMYAESNDTYFEQVSGTIVQFIPDTDGKTAELLLTSPMSSQQWRAQKK